MGSISTTTTSYIRKATQSKTGTASGTTKAKAIDAATTAANNATPSTMGSWSNNGTSSTKYLGINYGSKSTSVGVPYQSGSTWYCSWTASRTINHYQIKLAFTIPSELSAAAAVSSATLSIVTTGTLSTNNAFYVCAPASSSSTEPTAYTVNTASSIYSTKASFSGSGSANQTYTVTITNQLKQCVTAGKGWLVITIQSEDAAGYNYRATVTSASISYNLTTYTISYNKGANGTGTNTSDTKSYGVALTLKGAIFTRTGYTQTGWSTSDGGSKSYNLSASYTSNAATTLYPYWTINTYTVSYNKGANGTGTNTSDTKTYGVALTLKGAIFTRTGYTQTGWSTSDGGTKTYNLSASYTSNAATTLYPFWTINTYTISYNKGTNGTGTNTSDTKTYGVALTLKGAIFTRSGYVQTGWSTSDGGSKTYNLSASYTSNAATTLYPYWTVCSIRLVNGSSLDTYRVYIVNSSSGLDTYRVYVVNGSSLDAYS